MHEVKKKNQYLLSPEWLKCKIEDDILYIHSTLRDKLYIDIYQVSPSTRPPYVMYLMINKDMIIIIVDETRCLYL